MCAGLLPGTDPCLVSPSSCNRIPQAEGLNSSYPSQFQKLVAQNQDGSIALLGSDYGEHMGPLSYPYSSILTTSRMHGQLPKSLSPNTIISRAVVSKDTFLRIHAFGSHTPHSVPWIFMGSHILPSCCSLSNMQRQLLCLQCGYG